MNTVALVLLACLAAVGCAALVLPTSERPRARTRAERCTRRDGTIRRRCRNQIPADPTPAPPPAPTPAPALPTPVPTPALSGKVAECLAAHNKERAEVGVPPLEWSDALEATAQQWADTIKDSALRHSQGEFPDTGENLTFTTAMLSQTSYTKMIGPWIAEKEFFVNGVLPDDVSTTGRWADVGHYTAMIWRATTQVGCAAAEGPQGTTFVCHYKKFGNVFGQKTY